LREALKSRQLTVHYQPMVDGKNFQIIGLEALMRWNTATEGILSAAQFLKMAENLGLDGTFSDWVLQEACLQMRKWLDQGYCRQHKNFRMAVNICADQLADPELTGKITSILAVAGLPPSALAMELTEDAFRFDEPIIIENLKNLRLMGVALHLDDFSHSLGALQQASKIPFDCLKIDQIMTKVFLADLRGEALLESLLNISHILGLKVIAEGVENQQVYDWLMTHACDSMQGYFFCRPLPAIEMEMLLKIPHPS
jgi:EAL domain-containing protein (putative c-di-GMP-specific phosphodiesterase class I)